MADFSSDRNPVDALAEEFVERFRRGERPALSEFTDKYPQFADEIRDLFPALVMLEDVRPAPQTTAHDKGWRGAATGRPLERLGDYRILREVARGGMGIVYEAEQESLGRHVALKVLPNHALLDPRQLQRFQREARAAARLHHTNIVPVFGVGEEAGLHYYVMQFIQGQGLDQVLAVLQQLRKNSPGAPLNLPGPDVNRPSAPPSGDMASVAAVANSLLSGVFRATPPSPPGAKAEATACPLPSGVKEEVKVPVSASSSEVRLPGQPANATLSDSGQPYWQSVARIGIQAAEALAYAHGQGTLHRDIKPSNLLLDTQGIVWVADFGLAKASDSEDLTHTGDVVGTLRYMAPERFQGKADARSDIYALGLTLYELLTLRPAFDESERDKLLHQVMHVAPSRPRKLNPAVPRDLETVVLKALAHDPAHRYQTAAELAADLKRFVDDKPIHARPVSEIEKVWRWCRRNPSLASLAAAFLLSLALGIPGIAWKWREAELEKKHAQRAEGETVVQRDDAIAARNGSQRVSAGVLLDKGVALAEQGEVGEGLFWMLEALKAVPEKAPELRDVIRVNLAAWMGRSDSLQDIIEQPESTGRCAFAPDGKHFLTVSGRTVRSWDTSGNQLGSATIGEQGWRVLALGPDGQTILMGNPLALEGPGQMRLWDAISSRPVGDTLVQPAAIRQAALTPDGKQLVTAGADKIIRLWDRATKQIVQQVSSPGDADIVCLAVSPDGKMLATGASSASNFYSPAAAYVWDLTNGRQIGQPLSHRGAVLSVAFSPDGKWLLTGGEDRTTQVWDAATGRPAAPPVRHQEPARVARFSPDGRMILVGCDNGVSLWSGVPTARFIGMLPVRKVNFHDLAWGPDGETVIIGSTWNLTSGATHVCRLARRTSLPPALGERAFPGGVWLASGNRNSWWQQHLASFSPDASRLLAGSGDHNARLFDTATGQPACLPGGPFRHSWPAVDVTAYSPDGRYFATSGRDVTASADVRIWDAATGRPRGQPLPRLNYVAAMAFSPDSRLLVTGDYDRLVRFWDSATGKESGPPLPQVDIVLGLAFSPDGKMLAVSHSKDYSGSYGVVLWDVISRRQIGQPMPGLTRLFGFSADGKTLLTGEGSALRLWDTRTGLPIGLPTFETAGICCVAVRGDGAQIVVGTTEGTLRLRDPDSGKPIGTPMSSPNQVNAVVFSPDPGGRLILAGYADGSARLWDRATQKPIGPSVAQGKPIVAVAFTPDWRFFLTADDEGHTRRWPVPVSTEEENLDRLALRLQVHTGLEMNEGQIIVPLSPSDWQQRRRLLAGEMGGSATGVSDRQFHDARARDAEEASDAFAARWHLDRLLAAQEADGMTSGGRDLTTRPNEEWLTHARQARLDVAAKNFERAEAGYTRAQVLGSREKLLGWFRYCAADCLAAKQWQAALWYLDRVLAATPEPWHLWADRATVYEKLGNAKQHDADLATAIERGAESNFLVRVADDFARQGEWKQAAAALRTASERGPLGLDTWHALALACLRSDDRAGYARACARLLGGVGQAASPDVANSVAWLCVLGPDGVGDYARPIALAEFALSKAPLAAKPGVLNTLGAILYRAGRFRDAISRLHEGMQIAKNQGGIHDWIFLAMAHQRLGETAEAQRYLEKVNQSTPQKDGPLWSMLEIEVLRREAEALVKTDPSTLNE
jgi:WD40 repeat protein/serine/threonine protein kinase/Tfp pilus assembly protein PilF